MNRRSKSAVYVTQYKNLIKIILFTSIFYKFVVNFPLKLENISGLSISKPCQKVQNKFHEYRATKILNRYDMYIQNKS